jgi:TRAP-type C4-dicarboxylate transport system permease small subunit
LSRGSFVLGFVALFTAMAVDFASVIARHVGLRVLGSIEVIQLCIVAAISAAIVLATAKGSHAAVHLLTARLPPRLREGFLRVAEGMTALLFLLFLIADGWIAIELWPLGERSDLLGLPFAPARALWCLSMAFAAALALGAAIRGRGGDVDHGA